MERNIQWRGWKPRLAGRTVKKGISFEIWMRMGTISFETGLLYISQSKRAPPDIESLWAVINYRLQQMFYQTDCKQVFLTCQSVEHMLRLKYVMKLNGVLDTLNLFPMQRLGC